MTYRELANRLRALGCEELRQAKGSHLFWHNANTGQVTAIPDWSGKDLSPGTVRAIIRQLGISRKVFGSIK